MESSDTFRTGIGTPVRSKDGDGGGVAMVIKSRNGGILAKACNLRKIQAIDRTGEK